MTTVSDESLAGPKQVLNCCFVMKCSIRSQIYFTTNTYKKSTKSPVRHSLVHYPQGINMLGERAQCQWPLLDTFPLSLEEKPVILG